MPWIAAAQIIRNGEPSGSGIYLKSGLIITAAHMTAADAKMGVRIAGRSLPAENLKQGVYEGVDLTVLRVDEKALPANVVLPQVPLCELPPRPSDPVIVVDATNASRSHIFRPKFCNFRFEASSGH